MKRQQILKEHTGEEEDWAEEYRNQLWTARYGKRRLQKDECLEAYNMEYAGRNRKYYKLTDKGAAQLNLYRSEWENYSSKITRMFEEGV